LRTKAESRDAAVLVDEFDARGFESAPNYVERCTTRLAYPRFVLMHGHYFSRAAIAVAHRLDIRSAMTSISISSVPLHPKFPAQK
jgi:hypothetical protein